MKKKPTITWLSEPEAHDYPAAMSYLRLLFADTDAIALVNRLQCVGMVEFKAKDIFRASGLSLLGISNSHVRTNRKKICRGEALSPLLLVHDDNRVIVADGYHRLCAVYAFNEDAVIPCKIV